MLTPFPAHAIMPLKICPINRVGVRNIYGELVMALNKCPTRNSFKPTFGARPRDRRSLAFSLHFARLFLIASHEKTAARLCFSCMDMQDPQELAFKRSARQRGQISIEPLSHAHRKGGFLSFKIFEYIINCHNFSGLSYILEHHA